MQSEDLQADRRIGKRQALQQGFRTLPLRQVLSDDTPWQNHRRANLARVLHVVLKPALRCMSRRIVERARYDCLGNLIKGRCGKRGTGSHAANMVMGTYIRLCLTRSAKTVLSN
jgi:hypothetical protein